MFFFSLQRFFLPFLELMAELNLKAENIQRGGREQMTCKGKMRRNFDKAFVFEHHGRTACKNFGLEDLTCAIQTLLILLMMHSFHLLNSVQ